MKWETRALCEVIVETRNGLYKHDSFYGRGTPILKMFNIGRLDGQWVLDRVDRVELSDKESGDYSLQPGDLLVNRVNSRELVGKCALVDERTAGHVYESKNMRVRFNTEAVSPDWISLWMNGPDGRAKIEEKTKQIAGMATINKEDVLSLKIPLPPLPEQRRIAARLRGQLAEVAQALTALQSQLAAAEKLPQALLERQFNNESAMSFPRRKLGDVLSLRKEIVHPRNRPSGSTIFVGLEHVEPHTGRRLGGLPVEMSELSGRKPRFYPEDIVYGYLRPYLNKVWLADREGLCSVDQYVYAVSPAEADPAFVAWFMRSPIYRNRAPVSVMQSQLPRIRIEEVAAVEINLPDVRRQKEIVRQIEAEIGDAIGATATIRARLEAVEKLPAALLREVFGGANVAGSVV